MEASINNFYEIILHRDGAIFKVILKTIKIDIDDSTVIDAIVLSVLPSGLICRFFNILAKLEVDSCPSNMLLFRNNSLLTLAFRKFSSWVCGSLLRRKFISNVERVASYSNVLTTNKRYLKLLESETFDMFRLACEFVSEISLIFKEVFNGIQEIANEIFPTSSETVIAGLYFLRLICPLLTSPETHFPSLTFESTQKRNLISICKLIQSLVNQKTPSDEKLAIIASSISKNPAYSKLWKQCIDTFAPSISFCSPSNYVAGSSSFSSISDSSSSASLQNVEDSFGSPRLSYKGECEHLLFSTDLIKDILNNFYLIVSQVKSNANDWRETDDIRIDTLHTVLIQLQIFKCPTFKDIRFGIVDDDKKHIKYFSPLQICIERWTLDDVKKWLKANNFSDMMYLVDVYKIDGTVLLHPNTTILVPELSSTVAQLRRSFLNPFDDSLWKHNRRNQMLALKELILRLNLLQ